MAFCAACGTNLGSSAFCNNCGAPAGATASPSAIPPPTSPRSEQTLLQEAGIFISTSRFIAGSQTYAMSGVTSVGMKAEQPSRIGPVLAILFGAFWALIGLVFITKGGIVMLAFGCVIVALGIWIFGKRVPLYSVLLRSASGEQKATSSKDRALIERLVVAINEAIVLRG